MQRGAIRNLDDGFASGVELTEPWCPYHYVMSIVAFLVSLFRVCTEVNLSTALHEVRPIAADPLV